MEEKVFGKITAVRVGFGGYQGVMLGLGVDLSGGGYATSDFFGCWARKPDKYCKWTEQEQTETFGKVLKRIGELLSDAGKQEAQQLRGVPVEITFENNTLKSWRILKEVL